MDDGGYRGNCRTINSWFVPRPTWRSRRSSCAEGNRRLSSSRRRRLRRPTWNGTSQTRADAWGWARWLRRAAPWWSTRSATCCWWRPHPAPTSVWHRCCRPPHHRRQCVPARQWTFLCKLQEIKIQNIVTMYYHQII